MPLAIAPPTPPPDVDAEGAEITAVEPPVVRVMGDPPSVRVSPGPSTNAVIELPALVPGITVGIIVRVEPASVTMKGVGDAAEVATPPAGAEMTLPDTVMALPPAVSVVPGAITKAVTELPLVDPGITVGAIVVGLPPNVTTREVGEGAWLVVP